MADRPTQARVTWNRFFYRRSAGEEKVFEVLVKSASQVYQAGSLLVFLRISQGSAVIATRSQNGKGEGGREGGALLIWNAACRDICMLKNYSHDSRWSIQVLQSCIRLLPNVEKLGPSARKWRLGGGIVMR